jgi:hypothetical protein
MKKNRLLSTLSILFALNACATAPAAKADEIIQISTNGKYAFFVKDAENPELTLKRGVTYQIEVNTPGHPLWIKTKDSITTDNAYASGVTNNGIYKGTITFVVPADAPATLFYNCQYHLMMHGKINITD